MLSDSENHFCAESLRIRDGFSRKKPWASEERIAPMCCNKSSDLTVIRLSDHPKLAILICLQQ
jgi:hypothetical protein